MKIAGFTQFLLIIIGVSFNTANVGGHRPYLCFSGILDVVCAMLVRYSYAQLIALCPYSCRLLPRNLSDRLRLLGLWRPCRLQGHRLGPRRGVCAGRSRRRSLSQLQQQQCLQSLSTSSLSTVSASTLSFGFLNICSVGEKLDSLLDVRRDRSINVICLAETRLSETNRCGLRRVSSTSRCGLPSYRPTATTDVCYP